MPRRKAHQHHQRTPGATKDAEEDTSKSIRFLQVYLTNDTGDSARATQEEKEVEEDAEEAFHEGKTDRLDGPQKIDRDARHAQRQRATRTAQEPFPTGMSLRAHGCSRAPFCATVTAHISRTMISRRRSPARSIAPPRHGRALPHGAAEEQPLLLPQGHQPPTISTRPPRVRRIHPQRAASGAFPKAADVAHSQG